VGRFTARRPTFFCGKEHAVQVDRRLERCMFGHNQQIFQIEPLPTSKAADHQSNSGEGLLRVPAGSASHPKAKFLYRLRAPRRWWLHSTLRRVLEEFYNLPRRIVAVLNEPSLAAGPTIPLCPDGNSPGNFYEVNNWLHACNENIQRLQNQHPWIGALDFQICAQAFALGAGWGGRNACTKKHIEDQP
jgi:hypothetical protein